MPPRRPGPVAFGAGAHRARGCSLPRELRPFASHLGDIPLQPPLVALADVSLVILGAILGALAFSFVIGRRRARQVARLADRLAQAANPGVALAPVHYPDPVLDDSLRRLASRISEVEALASTDQVTRLLNRPACLQMLATEI